MAKQKGIIKLRGTIGDVSFYKGKNGYLAREKTDLTGDRIKTDPAFKRTRENGQEFGEAGRSGRILRTSLRPTIQKVSDGRVSSRLTKVLMQILKTDFDNIRGERKVTNGDLSLLLNFDFNREGKLNSTFYAPFDPIINRVEGTATIDLSAFTPEDSMAYPSGATHFRFLSAISGINFEADDFFYQAADSSEIVIGNDSVDIPNLTMDFIANSPDPLFLVFGVEFFQEINGMMYTLKNGAYNSLALVGVDQTSAEPNL